MYINNSQYRKKIYEILEEANADYINCVGGKSRIQVLL